MSLKLSTYYFKQISTHLQQLRVHIPLEINRKPRGLEDLARWKGTEFRTFLLYLGPIVLKDNINIAIYEHFLLLHVGISILVSRKYISKFSSKYANKVLTTFIQHSKEICGTQFLIYNVHLLSHVTDDVDNFGPLDEFATFSFQSYLGKLKKYIKSSTNPLQQICRRLIENFSLSFNNIRCNLQIELKYRHNLGPLHTSISHMHCEQYEKLIFYDVAFLINSNADCYCMLDESIVIQILNIVQVNNTIFIIGNRL